MRLLRVKAGNSKIIRKALADGCKYITRRRKSAEKGPLANGVTSWALLRDTVLVGIIDHASMTAVLWPDLRVDHLHGKFLGSGRGRLGELPVGSEDADQMPGSSSGTTGAPTDGPLATLVAKAQAKLDEAVDEDRAELIDLVETIRDCQERSDLAGLDVARKQLTDLLFYLET